MSKKKKDRDRETERGRQPSMATEYLIRKEYTTPYYIESAKHRKASRQFNHGPEIGVAQACSFLKVATKRVFGVGRKGVKAKSSLW